jgi:short-subunit dehydrogenase
MSNTATLITGASSGIGEAMARQLAAEQQTLVLVARRREKLEALAQELRAAHRIRVEVLAADLEQVGAAAALMAQVEGLGLSVDTLINNAGFGINAEFADMAADRVSAMLHLNVVALTELTHAVLPAMLSRQQGRIMNIASVAAFQPCPRFAEYGASKAYVLSFTEALAAEVASKGVKVTAVCPGATRTEFHDVAHNDGVLATRFMDSAEEVATAGLRALNSGTRVIVTGIMNKPLPFLVRLTPRRLVVWLAGKTVTPKAA